MPGTRPGTPTPPRLESASCWGACKQEPTSQSHQALVPELDPHVPPRENSRPVPVVGRARWQAPEEALYRKRLAAAWVLSHPT